MKILFFGDIFGRSGRNAVKRFLEEEKNSILPDLVIANSDNIASGRGPTLKTYEELIDAGVDILTPGDHIWDQKEVTDLVEDKKTKISRPLNFPAICQGKTYVEAEVKGKKVIAVGLLGRVWMTEGLESPFTTMDAFIDSHKNTITIVDLHAEATSEKNALGHYLAGRVAAVLGSHTHVQTSDEKIIDGTAYISDVGFCGPSDSVIGVVKEQSIKKFVSGMPITFEAAEGPSQINAVLVEIDEGTGKATKIERILRLYD